MTAPRIRTYKCRQCERKLFDKRCLDCGTADVLDFIDVADPLAAVELPDLNTFNLPPFGGIDPSGGSDE